MFKTVTMKKNKKIKTNTWKVLKTYGSAGFKGIDRALHKYGSFTNWGVHSNESLTMTITKRQNWVTLSSLTLNWTHSILHYCKTFTFRQRDEKQRTEIWKDKKRKKKKTKAVARRRLRERTESLKEEKEECKCQVLNARARARAHTHTHTHTHTQREREREIVSARLQLCGHVGDLVV